MLDNAPIARPVWGDVLYGAVHPKVHLRAVRAQEEAVNGVVVRPPLAPLRGDERVEARPVDAVAREAEANVRRSVAVATVLSAYFTPKPCEEA